MKNVYDGIAKLDARGRAVVHLPAYFEALNDKFRYQVTPLGRWTPLFIEKEIVNNTFVIASDRGSADAGRNVSWQVTGVRIDAFALKHPVIVEQEKGTPGIELNVTKGQYLHPDSFEDATSLNATSS